MELLIGLVVLGVIGVALYGVLGVGFLGWAGSRDAKAKDRAPDILDNLFSGPEQVTYRTGIIGTLPFEDVVLGGIKRGYTLRHESNDRGQKVLVFELTEPEKVSKRPERTDSPPTRLDEGSPDSRGAILAGFVTLAGALVLLLSSPEVAVLAIVVALVGLGLIVYGARRRT